MSAITLLRGPLDGAVRTAFDAVVPGLYPAGSLRHGQQDSVPPACFKEALVALSEGLPAARCCLYDNPGICPDGRPALLIGNFEAAPGVAGKALLDEAAATARRMGKAVLVGPLNGSTWDAYRFVIGPQPDPFLTEPVQPPYYAALFEAHGFEVLHRYGTWIAPIAAPEDAAPLPDSGLAFRTLTEERFAADLLRLHGLCHRAFQANPLYTPLSQEAFLQRYAPFAALLADGYSSLAEDAAGTPVAFLLAFRDRYDPRRLVLKTVAKEPSCLVKGLASALTHRTLARAAADGCTTVLHAFIHESNTRSLARSHDFGGRPYREYRLYAKSLTP